MSSRVRCKQRGPIARGERVRLRAESSSCLFVEKGRPRLWRDSGLQVCEPIAWLCRALQSIPVLAFVGFWLVAASSVLTMTTSRKGPGCVRLDLQDRRACCCAVQKVQGRAWSDKATGRALTGVQQHKLCWRQ